MRSILIGASGDAPEVNTLGDVAEEILFAGMEDAPLPDWLTDEDLEYFTAEFERTGYRGGLNWYRNSVLNWELMAAWHKAPLLPPSLYVTGDRDLVYNWPGMTDLVTKLRRFSMPNLSKGRLSSRAADTGPSRNDRARSTNCCWTSSLDSMS